MQKHGFTRREFLQGTVAVTSVGLIAPGLLADGVAVPDTSSAQTGARLVYPDDAFASPAIDRLSAFEDLIGCYITHPTPLRASLYAENSLTLARHKGGFRTNWRICTRETGVAVAAIRDCVRRAPSSVSFRVVNESAEPVSMQWYFDEMAWCPGKESESASWILGDVRQVGVGEEKVLTFHYSEAYCHSKPGKKTMSFPAYPMLVILGLKPGAQYSLLLSELTVSYPSAGDLTVTAIACPPTVCAGKSVAIDIHAGGRIAGRTVDLEFRRDRYVLWRVRLDREEVAELQRGSCRVCRTVPWYIPAGGLVVSLAADGYHAGGPEAAVTVENSTRAELPLAERRQHNGRPTFFLNGKPCPWQGHSSYDYQPGNVAEFGASGANVFCVPCAAGVHIHGVSAPTWTAQGVFDFGQIDERVCFSLQANPDATIFLRLSLALPPFWTQTHPDDLALLQTDSGPLHWEETGTIAVSIASQAWMRDQERILRELIRYCRVQPWARRVAGIWLTGEVTEEWFAWGCNDGLYADYGVRNQDEFARWLADHGLPVPAGGRPVPMPGKRKRPGCDVYPDDGDGRLAAAYQQYYSDLTVDVISRLAKVVKDETSGRCLVGTFYGYVIQLAGEPRQATSGHFALRRLLDDPNVDFLGGIPLHNFRNLDGCSSYATTIDSVLSAGKLYCNDNDIFSWLHQSIWYREYDPSNPRAGTISMQRRETAKQAVHGVEGQWFSLMSTWHHDAELQKDFSKLITIQRESLTYDRTPVEEIAFIVDDSTFAWTPPETTMPVLTNVYLMYRLARTGAPIGSWLLSDLDKLPERIRFVAIGSSTAARPEEIAKLRAMIERGGRTILVVGAPGLVNPRTQRWQPETVSDLLGMPIRIDDAALPGGMTLRSDGSQIGSPDHSPRPRVRLEGEGFAHYPDGATSAAERPLAHGGRLIWCGMPPLSTHLLRQWAQEAGVHCYAPEEYSVYASRELVSITAPRTEDALLKWPHRVEVLDLLDRQHAEGTEFTCQFQLGQTRLFQVRRR